MIQRRRGKARPPARKQAIDLCHIVDAVEARAHVTLRRGTHELPGEPGVPPARIAVGRREAAEAIASARCDGKQIVLTHAEARFTPALTIRNPARSLDPSRPALYKLFADLLADLDLSSVKLDPESGQLHPETEAVVLGVLRFPYRPDDAAMRRLRVPVPVYPFASVRKKIEALAPLVRPALAVIERLRLDLAASTQPIGVPRVPGVTLALGRIALRPSIELRTEDGAIHWCVSPTEIPQVECDLLRARLSSEGRLSIGAEDRCELRGTLGAAITARSWPLVLSPAPGFAIPVVFGKDAGVAFDGAFSWREAGRLEVEPIRAIFDLRGGIGADGITFAGATLSFAESEATVTGDAKLSLGGKRIDVSSRGLEAKVGLETPTLRLGSTRISVDGRLDLRLEVKELSAARDGLRLSGALDLALDVAGVGSERHALARRGLPVSFAVYGEGTLAVKPLDGVLDALEPWIDLNGDVRKVRELAHPAAGKPGSEAIARAIVDRTGAQRSEANHVELLVDGVMSFPRRTEIIEAAKRSICIQYLIFQDDRTGCETARLLVKKVKQGVKVRVIIDTLGNIDPFAPLARAFDHEVYDILREGGVDLRLYNGPDGVLGDLAEKLLAELMSQGKTMMARIDPLAILGALARIVRREKERPEGSRVATLQRAADKILRKPSRTTTMPRSGDTFDFDDLLLVVRAAAALNHRWHEKYLIVDERVAIMGGMNIADEYLLGGTPAKVHDRTAWRDTDIAIEGPAVADLHRAFAKNWQAVSGETLPAAPRVAAPAGGTKCTALVVQHRPREDGDHHIQNALLEHLVSLGKGDRAWFANAYVLPVGGLAPLRRALIQAGERGVDVRIVTNSVETTDLKQLNYASIPYYRELLKAGVRIWERTGDRTMHSKYALLGPSTVAIGSWNMDNRSESLNSEALTLIDDPAFAERAAATFTADAEAGVAIEITREAVLSQPVEQELRSLAYSALAEML